MPYQRTADQIRETHHRKHLRLDEASIMPACRELCAYWHNKIGACYTLNAQRLRGLRRYLANPVCSLTAADIKAAIDAYHADDWHQKNPQARMEFGKWLESGQVEVWIDRAKKQQHVLNRSVCESIERREINRLALAAGLDVRSLLQQAIDELPGNVTNPTLTNPAVRASILRTLREGPAKSRGLQPARPFERSER